VGVDPSALHDAINRSLECREGDPPLIAGEHEELVYVRFRASSGDCTSKTIRRPMEVEVSIAGTGCAYLYHCVGHRTDLVFAIGTDYEGREWYFLEPERGAKCTFSTLCLTNSKTMVTLVVLAVNPVLRV
jgi:hypothetical protein